jgi:hypothetical protein
MSHKVTDRRYDMTGESVLRITKHSFISKFAPYEDFAGGPGWKCLVAASLMHYFGGIISWFLIRYEQKLKATARSFLAKFTRRQGK